MKRLLLASLFLLLNCIVVSSVELNRSVCVVYCTDAINDSIYSTLAKALHRKGYLSAERSIKKSGDSFGSGFVYKSQSGVCYIVTNQHVVGGSNLVRISSISDGKMRTYNGCRVLYADKTRDLAILQIPAEMPVFPLERYNNELSDGLDVYTAGFPGLGNTPSWQLGKGIISNAAVRSDIFEKDTITVIQHTAQVDPGNSGGPLLIAQPSDSDRVYKVIGVNTWKARRRNDTNFSVRVSELDLFIEDYNKGVYTNKIIFDSVRTAFEASVKRGYEGTYKYISEKMVLSLSESGAVTMLELVDNNINALLRSSDPMVAMRMLVAKVLVKKLGSDFTVADLNVTGNIATVTYRVKKENVSVKWEDVNNGWSIVSCSYIDNDVRTSSSTSLLMDKSGLYDTDWVNTVSLGVTFPLSVNQFYGGSIDYSYAFLNYGLISLGVDVDGVYPVDSGDKTIRSATPKVNFNLYAGFGARLPINIKRFVLIPYASLGTGGGIFYSDSVFGTFSNHGFKIIGFVRPGLQFGYMLNQKCMLFTALEYTYKFGSSKSAEFPFNYGTLGLRVGVGF